MSILYLYSYLKDNPHLCHFIKKKDMRCVIPHQSNAVNIPHQSDAELNRRGASVQSTTGSRGVRTSGGNAGYTMFRGTVKGIGYPLHSPVSPSLPLPCVTVCHHISTGLYQVINAVFGNDYCVRWGSHETDVKNSFHGQNTWHFKRYSRCYRQLALCFKWLKYLNILAI